MKIVVKKPNPDPPYSLHDAHILELRLEGENLRLVTQYGYVHTSPPFDQVEGDVEITGVDAESSCVYVMEYPQVPCGNYGIFTGRKIPLEAFLEEFSEATLEILDETYGYQMVKLSGFLDLPDRLLEYSLELCYTGEFRYLLKN